MEKWQKKSFLKTKVGLYQNLNILGAYCDSHEIAGVWIVGGNYIMLDTTMKKFIKL